MTYRRWFSIFFLVLLGSAAVLVAALFYAMHLVRLPGYYLAGDPYSQVEDRGFEAHGEDCQVLIYGDSSTSIGIDPRIVTRETGMSSCNIATVRPVVDDLGSPPVDAFLRNNPRPKVLVMRFAPEVFYNASQHWERDPVGAPMLMLTRDMPEGFALKEMALHPAETLQFEYFVLRDHYLPDKLNAARFRKQYEDNVAFVKASRGMMSLPLPPSQSCDYAPYTLWGPVNRAFVDDMRRRYELPGMTLLIVASPVPDCDSELDIFRRELAPLLDGPIATEPIQTFESEGRHATPSGSVVVTEQLVGLIEAKIGAKAGAPQPHP